MGIRRNTGLGGCPGNCPQYISPHQSFPVSYTSRGTVHVQVAVPVRTAHSSALLLHAANAARPHEANAALPHEAQLRTEVGGKGSLGT